jgi:type II secretory pathway component PulF
MATKTQKKFRNEMKVIQKENPTYFEKNNIYLKRTSSLKRKVIRNVSLTGVVILIIRLFLFVIIYIVPEFGTIFSNWLKDYIK